MRTVHGKEFSALVKGGTVITINGGGVSVIRTTDDRFIKIFRPSSWLSSDLFSPRPLRFEKAVKVLESRNIPTVKNLDILWIPSMKKYAAYYRPLEGEELREALPKSNNPDAIIERWIRFLASIHQLGIYFRGINFSNVLLCPDGSFGLIDVGSVQAKNKSLGGSLRARNLKHPLAYSEDLEAIEKFGVSRLVRIYLEETKFDERQKKKFLNKLGSQHSVFAHLL